MEWYEFLRAERARKLENIDWLESGRSQFTMCTDGVLKDCSAEMIQTNRQHIAEIEEILSAANQPIA